MASESTQADPHDKAWEKAEKKFTHKHASEYYDPCQDFADRSLKCMRRNASDREMCHDYFHLDLLSYAGFVFILSARSINFDAMRVGVYSVANEAQLTQKKVSLTPQPK
ncbi:hypothetical protein N7447_010677 [Penicillium robsamsonii]|uniref:uncharacterized protein n=1 Tax=Penicillium robsamsonii TaxID=1792511 RepID=UPI002546A28A|nr:uncharacterized protein N7447_010677 [Penicillium robsamsonii]KAJ5811161.1 hypothetical protein N7447_010677 [Penicillium robsamsonii]